MVFKLAFSHLKQSKGFFTFLVTLSLSVAIFYAFISVYPQTLFFLKDQVTSSNRVALESMQMGLITASVFVSMMFAFLVIYVNLFFVKKRNKEFALYLLLGFSKAKVGSIYFLENLLISVLAFVLGIGLGIGLSQVLGLFTSKMFTSSFDFYFSFQSCLITLAYFSFLFLLVILLSIRKIFHAKLITLFQSDKQNESLKIVEKKRRNIILLILSIIFLLVSFALMLMGFIETCFIVFITGTISAFLFFLSFSGILFHQIEKKNKIMYSGLNLYTIKDLVSHINSSSLSLAFVSLVLILTCYLMSCGLGINLGYSGDEQMWYGLSYIAIYMGISFLLVACSLLAIKEMSLLDENISNYQFLYKLGASKKQIRKSILKEEILYFTYPLGFSTLASIVGLFGAHREVLHYMQSDITKGIGVSVIVILGFYFAYFIITYISNILTLKKSLN